MYILGLNAYHGDSSAALLKDGKLICAFEEERFNRHKHWAGFPLNSIKACLSDQNIELSDIEYITIGRDPNANLIYKIFLPFQRGIDLSWVSQRLANRHRVGNIQKDIVKYFSSSDVQLLKSKIINIEHHRSHLASAFFASSFSKSALLTIDAFGDFTSCMIGVGEGNHIRILDQVRFPHSIGIFYTAFTQYLGFTNYGDEYKVMGLAPYGNPIYVNELYNVIKPTADGLFKLNLNYFVHPRKGVKTNIFINNDPTPSILYSDILIDKFGPVRAKDAPLNQRDKDLAASVQRVTEEVIFHLLHHLHAKTGLEQVCIAGGVAQNSVANGKITRHTPFKQVYIPSAGHDAGIAAGSAMYHYFHTLGHERKEPIYSAYTGSHFSNEEIERVLKQNNVPYKRYSDEELYELVAERLINAGVVGWFQGRAEFGPRALGGRSIIADPRRTDAKDLLNAKIKRRESFRPFAPSILKEYVSEYFEVTDEVPFMEKVFPIKPEKHQQIPAVTHVDGTGRLQTVDKTVSPRYYRLIDTFRRKTGVPILLNTSFNENEPIVNTPQEALNCYLRTQMDMLVLENCVVSR